MPADESPNDDNEQLRQTYNFAPGYHGLIYRAHTTARGHENDEADDADDAADAESQDHERGPSPKKAKLSHGSQAQVDGRATEETKYKIQAARWGLVPFWTKRPPDYGSQMRTINCRDDSLIENRGMWNTMKQRKRCVVVAEGFYEWLKKNNGKEKIPHFTKRKDGQLMCFAGLWDMVQYEGSDEKLYTYTVITTDSNQQLKFLHDRMPVIMEPGSDEMKAWLDPANVGWSKELQNILKPYQGELECYPVDKAVGKVGNNSPSFVVPIDSKENKKNIANFFGTQRATAKDVAAKNEATKIDEDSGVGIDSKEERQTTTKLENSEGNAPLPKPEGESEEELSQRIKKESAELGDSDIIRAADEQVEKGIKREIDEVEDEDLIKAAEGPAKKIVKLERPTPSPNKSSSPDTKLTGSQKTRSATSNNSILKSPTKGGNAKITSFFGGK
ncbi:Hypothetical predicted protein [Lecanosticta acicola]|uniref:DUF159 domain protein n=1 Tax=Lecanosticta acicola TaxID=111012 RepID=A0AAI8W198_9PEZI|nr:Hypothetical predicted protein [Lecanosticta acicola]